MVRKDKFQSKGVIELTEEAVHLLRMTPIHLLLTYYVGAVPFVLGFLYFWADMSRSSDAHQRCGTFALVLALLFVWMKTWQVIFASELHSRMSRRAEVPWTLRRILQIAGSQCLIQSTGLFLVPLALVIMLPFGWVYAFYQNATALGNVTKGEIKNCCLRAGRQSQLWQVQNHFLLSIFFLIGTFVFLNVCVGIIQIPWFLKTFLGIETVFSKGGTWSILNTTFFAITGAITYLCLDPLVKAVYVLRCFYGESLTTAEDLRAELQANKASSRTTVMVALISVLALGQQNFTHAEAAAKPATSISTTQPTVSSSELDRSINDVLKKREFSWRLPREQMAEKKDEQKSWLTLVIEGIGNTLSEAMKSVRKVVRDVFEWLDKNFFKGDEKVSQAKKSSSTNWMLGLQLFVVVLIGLVACVVAILILRLWKQRQRTREVVVAQVVNTPPDIADENVVANQLPEDGWLKMARELMEQGNLRLALRALYLAGLAHLAERQMISIAKFKSNRDYESELRRRARAIPDLQTAFTDNVTIFDRVWYGMHEVTDEALRDFQANLERIRAC